MSKAKTVKGGKTIDGKAWKLDPKIQRFNQAVEDRTVEAYRQAYKRTHGRLLTLEFTSLEWSSLELCANRHEDGDLKAYAKGSVMVALEHDVEVMARPADKAMTPEQAKRLVEADKACKRKAGAKCS